MKSKAVKVLMAFALAASAVTGIAMATSQSVYACSGRNCY